MRKGPANVETNRRDRLHTRTSAAWTGVVAGLVVAVILLVFVVQNTQRSRIDFFGAHTSLPLSVALLVAAVAGGLLVLIAGLARTAQLHRTASRRTHALPDTPDSAARQD